MYRPEIVSVPLTAEEKQKLLTASKEAHLTMSAYIRLLIASATEKEK